MIDPRKNNFEHAKHDLEAQHQFSNFPRIQVNPRRVVNEDDFQSLSTPTRQQLMAKLIDHVRDL